MAGGVTQNGSGRTNGANGHGSPSSSAVPFARFSAVPRAMDIPVSSGDIEEAVEVDLEDLMDDPTELCTLLENENVAKNYWMTIALAYAKQQKVDLAIDIVAKGLSSISKGGGKPEDKLALLSCLCWLYIWQCRTAPRLKPEGQLASEARTKDYYIRHVTTTLNEASRISPTYHPLLLARGVLQLIRASLQQRPTERIDTLTQAAKFFADALRASSGRNVMAIMGQARALFSLGKYADALGKYQQALENAPDLVDPDPRIGIGCCFWQLGHHNEAQIAWKRSLELNPASKMANILLGLFHLAESARLPTTDPDFQQHYKRAMTEYTQTAWKLDNKFPLTCATFANYFLLRKAWPTVEKLARQAIEATDVNAIAGDGWYLLARKEHYEGDIAKATDYYNRADQARGGDDKGYLPAKFGAAQLRTLARDFEGAKHRLERIVHQSKNVEAMTLLGLLYAEDVYANQAAAVKEDMSSETNKAIALLEQVRNSWKDPKKKHTPDPAVLLNLARLYEVDSPEKSLQCLQQVETMEIDDIAVEDRPRKADEAETLAALRESLPPQLLNNMAAFHYQAERYGQARELFQSALNACVKIGDKDSTIDADALVTTISFNLARTYEAEGLTKEARQVYDSLVQRHSDYTDARIRLAYLDLLENPSEQSTQGLKKLLDADPSDLEIRALYGWHLHKVKRRTLNPAEDQEQRHYKHSLQDYDKHDRYSLTGMGNIFIQVAREMRRDTDQDKDKRSKTYARAIEFFDKALQLDPRNAYAAQGIAIALAEEKKDHAGAIQIFTGIREALRDASVFLNLGHSFCEVKQYSRAIENYELALARSRGPSDPSILACLGRVWLLKGKQEKNLPAMKSSLEYSLRALEVAPEQAHFRFNVAFVQIQIASLIYGMPDAARTLVDVETAAKGLDEAIETLMDIAKGPNPPFPRHDIEQRANMGKNTMRKQLDRAMTSQREYESKNAARLEQARSQREAEIKKREDQKRAMAEAELEKRRLIKEERERIATEDRKIIEDKLAEEAMRKDREAVDMTTDEETGEKKKREKRKKGGKGSRRTREDDDLIDDRSDNGYGDSDSGASDAEGAKKKRKPARGSLTPAEDGGEGEARKTKRRKLERKSKAVKENSKFKSSEVVVDSDSDDEAVREANNNTALASKLNEDAVDQENARLDEQLDNMSDGDEEEAVAAQPRRKKRAVVDEDDDDDEEDVAMDE
ncbi:hypothetical protein AAFC00_002929 [Neodothiora populina]|uniref:TPR-like protein n=1 Tax=Neodothiora populina TaxID=2781224 RepID=A0ABR3P8Q0_9PEZI